MVTFFGGHRATFLDSKELRAEASLSDQLLQKNGLEHEGGEAVYLLRLKDEGNRLVAIPQDQILREQVALKLNAPKSGAKPAAESFDPLCLEIAVEYPAYGQQHQDYELDREGIIFPRRHSRLQKVEETRLKRLKALEDGLA